MKLFMLVRFPGAYTFFHIEIKSDFRSAMTLFMLLCFPGHRLTFENKSTPVRRNQNSPLKQIRIFLARRNQTPHRSVLPVLPSICVYFKNVTKSKKCVIVVVIENAKFKLLNVLSSYNNALCDIS